MARKIQVMGVAPAFMADGPETIVVCFVQGRPVVPSKALGRRDSPDAWTSRVIDSTLQLSQFAGSFELDVEFVLPADRDPWELPWEMTLDNLLKWLLDALEGTALRSVLGEERRLVAVSARERVARPNEETGAYLVFRRATPPT